LDWNEKLQQQHSELLRQLVVALALLLA